MFRLPHRVGFKCWYETLLNMAVYEDFKEQVLIEGTILYNECSIDFSDNRFHNLIFQMVQNNEQMVARLSKEGRIIPFRPKSK